MVHCTNGASSVLLFAVPTSPLAQPWNVIVGNTLAGIIGVACAQWIPDLTTAFSVAVGFAIFLMMTTDSLHPPSGAVAITAVLGGAAIHKLGFYFVFIRFCSIHYFYSVLLYFLID